MYEEEEVEEGRDVWLGEVFCSLLTVGRGLCGCADDAEVELISIILNPGAGRGDKHVLQSGSLIALYVLVQTGHIHAFP